MLKNLLILMAISCLSCNKINLDEFEVSLIDRGAPTSGLGDFENQKLIIETESDWISFTENLSSFSYLFNDLVDTDINFDDYKVIAVFGERETYAAQFMDLDIIASDDNITVKSTTVYPELNGNVIHAFVQPYHIVKITAFDLPIVFE